MSRLPSSLGGRTAGSRSIHPIRPSVPSWYIAPSHAWTRAGPLRSITSALSRELQVTYSSEARPRPQRRAWVNVVSAARRPGAPLGRRPGVTAYLLRRTAVSVVVLIGISMIVFLLLHLLRNAFLPMITLIGLSIPALLAGT